jgi:hypothetical protein
MLVGIGNEHGGNYGGDDVFIFVTDSYGCW